MQVYTGYRVTNTHGDMSGRIGMYTLKARQTCLAIRFSLAVRMTGNLFSLPCSSRSTLPSNAWCVCVCVCVCVKGMNYTAQQVELHVHTCRIT